MHKYVLVACNFKKVKEVIQIIYVYLPLPTTGKTVQGMGRKLSKVTQ